MTTPTTVYACIDGLATTHAVVDGAFWAAQRLQAPMALLHALERPEPMPPVGDYSGVIGMGAQDVLLQRLNTLDEERSQVAQEAARRGVAASFLLVRVTTALLERIARLIAEGRLATRVGAVLPLADARVAHEMLEGARPRPSGKIVLRV